MMLFSRQVSQKTEKKANLYRRGISLMETAVFVSIMALMMMGGSKVYDTKQAYDRQKVTADNLKIVKTYIESYRAKNGRLPCAASRTSSPYDSGSNFGRSVSCTATDPGTKEVNGYSSQKARIGTIPTRELGLPDAAMIDGWGNRLVYVVTEAYTAATPDENAPGAITLYDGAGNIIKSQADDAAPQEGGIVYTVFSLGPDRRGAYNINGQLQDTCPSSGLAKDNCADDDAKFTTSLNKNYSAGGKFAPLFVYGAQSAQAVSLDESDVSTTTGACDPTPSFNSSANCPEHDSSGNVWTGGHAIVMEWHSCPDNVFHSTQVDTSLCAYSPPCSNTTETRTVTDQCQAGYVGSKDQKRDYTCVDERTGNWGAWTTTADHCIPACTPTSETRTVTDQCPSGQVGSIDQHRDYTCSGGVGTWGNWYSMASDNHCVTACVPTSETRVVSDQCPEGYSGTKTQKRDYTCATQTSGSWGGWTTTEDNCVANGPAACVPGAPGQWQTFVEAGHTSTTPESNYLFGYPQPANPNEGYEFGDCHELKRQWKVTYNSSNLQAMIDEAYGIIDPQFFSAFGTHFDKSALFQSFADPSQKDMVYQSSHINGISGGFVPWLKGTNGVDSYTYCSKRRVIASVCNENCPAGKWETFKEANHLSTHDEYMNISGLWYGTPIRDPNWGYEFGDCHLMRFGYQNTMCNTQEPYDMLNPQFVSTYGISIDPNDISNGYGTDCHTTPSYITIKYDNLTGKDGGPVPWALSIMYDDVNPSYFLTCGKRRLKDDPNCDATCTPRQEHRSVSCNYGDFDNLAYEVRDYTCNSGVGSWSAWHDDTSGQPGPWETYVEAQHVHTMADSFSLPNVTTSPSHTPPDLTTLYDFDGCKTIVNWVDTAPLGGTGKSLSQQYDLAKPVLFQRFKDAFGIDLQNSPFQPFSMKSGETRIKLTGSLHSSPSMGNAYWWGMPDGYYMPWLVAADGKNSYDSTATDAQLNRTYTFCTKRRKKATSPLKSCSTPCVPTSETRDVGCNPNETGSHTQKRDYTCPGPTGNGTWSAWYDVSNSCSAACTPMGTCTGNYSYDVTAGGYTLTSTDCPGGYAPGDNSSPKMEIPGYNITGSYGDESNGYQSYCPPYGLCVNFSVYYDYCRP